MNKEKQQRLKELSKKYFWEQKATEICLFILIVLGIIVASHISGSIMKMLFPQFVAEPLFVVGVLGLVLLFISGVIIFGIGKVLWMSIEDWIESNKEKASNRAKKELGIKDRWDY